MAAETSKIVTPAGSAIKKLREAKFDPERGYYLEECGVEDIDKKIQAAAVGCDVSLIVARYAAGEVDVLSKVQGAYGDFSKTPKTYAEYLNKVLAGERLFNSLPPAIKEKFKNSPEIFLAQAGTPEWFTALGVTKEAVISKANTDVKEEKNDVASA